MVVLLNNVYRRAKHVSVGQISNNKLKIRLFLVMFVRGTSVKIWLPVTGVVVAIPS
jgi:hypothetical protein